MKMLPFDKRRSSRRKKKSPPRQRNSTIREPSHKEKLLAAQRLRSTTPPKQKRKSKAEQAAKLDREYGGPERLTWLHSLSCVACGHRGNIEAAHVISGGTSRKADARWTVPLCGSHLVVTGTQDQGNLAEVRYRQVEGCHRHLHRVGQRTFELQQNVDLKFAASKIEAEWQSRVMAGKS